MGKVKSSLKYFSIACMLILACAAKHLYAAENKIAIVNMEQVFTDSPQGQAIDRKLELDFKPKKQDLMQMDEELKRKYEELNRDKATMTKKQIASKEQDINKLQQKLQQKYQELEEEAFTKSNDAKSALFQKVSGLIQEIAKRDGYNLVLPNRVALYYNNTVDITEEVLKKLAQAPKE